MIATVFPKMVLPLPTQDCWSERQPVGELNERVGRNIARLRELRDMSRYRLGKLANISNAHLMKIEKGQTWPSEGKLVRIAAALAVRPEVFFADDLSDFGNMITIDLDSVKELIEASEKLIEHVPGRRKVRSHRKNAKKNSVDKN